MCLLLAGLITSAGCAPRSTTSVPNRSPSGSDSATGPASAVQGAKTFAVIGDYGVADENELAVSKLVSSQNPDFVVTAGDNYYNEAGGRGMNKYEKSAGVYYGAWMKGVPAGGAGQTTGTAAVNGFFPILGNHDYTDATPSLETYLNYFTLPGAGFTSTSGNERYYDFVQGPVHVFVLNSNPQEPDGTNATSRQAQWLREQLAASTSPWNIVFAHHPPYSSDNVHGPTPRMQWPFAAWGADAVISGHVHTYERIVRDGTVYFVNGLGGEAPRHSFSRPVAGSAFQYNAGFGAQKLTATATTLDFEFYDVYGALVDSYRLSAGAPPAN